jgi:nitrite reductase (NO-forming)
MAAALTAPPPVLKVDAVRVAAIEALPRIKAPLTMAPHVPPPIERRTPARLVVDLYSTEKTMPVSPSCKYPFWTFNDGVPGPMIRARVGDVLEVPTAASPP